MNDIMYFPELGHLEITESYVFYDEPVLFAARNERDQIFLSVMTEESIETKRWLYLPLSLRRFQEIRSGGLDLYSAFRTAEGGYVFSVSLPKIEGRSPSAHWTACASLADEDLPIAGERIILQTDTLADVPQTDVLRSARQVRKEVLSLRFEFSTTGEIEIKYRLLALETDDEKD